MIQGPAGTRQTVDHRPPTIHPQLTLFSSAASMFFMTGLNERVIQEMERLLQRPLTSEEIRLLLLANVIEEDILDSETSFPVAA